MKTLFLTILFLSTNSVFAECFINPIQYLEEEGEIKAEYSYSYLVEEVLGDPRYSRRTVTRVYTNYFESEEEMYDSWYENGCNTYSNRRPVSTDH